jgi:hypothetical protein
LKNQFSKLTVEEIDSYLLDVLKSRLFFDYQTDKINNPPNRYSNSNKIEGTNHEKIISFLKKENSNSVSIEVSSLYPSSSYPITNLFVDNNLSFATLNIPNSSICFSFHSHKISISKYFIRSCNSDKNTNWLKNWNLEGSNDKSN